MKLFKLLLAMLALALLFSACANTQNNPQNTTESAADTTESVPPSPIGIWFSDKDCYAVQIHTVTSATFYKTKFGYYRYIEKADVTCDDVTVADLQFSISEGTTLTLHYDNTAGTLTNTANGSVYVKQVSVPLLYHAFPTYSEFDYSSLITLNGLDTLTYPADAKSMAARDIFDEVYANISELPELTTRQTAQKGDYVNIDYTGYLDGEKFSGGEATNQMVLIVDESDYIPGFVEGIVGHTVGETFSVPVTFPEDYGSTDLAGKSVTFEMKLNAIYKTEASDEQIKVVTNNAYETYAAYLADLEKEIASDLLWSKALETVTFSELPENTYIYFYQYISDPYREYAKQYGMDYESFLTMMVGISDSYILNYAQEVARSFILAHAIAKQENLTVNADELQAEIERLTAELEAEGYTAEEIANYLDEEQHQLISAQLLRDTVAEWLLTASQNQ